MVVRYEYTGDVVVPLPVEKVVGSREKKKKKIIFVADVQVLPYTVSKCNELYGLSKHLCIV